LTTALLDVEAKEHQIACEEIEEQVLSRGFNRFTASRRQQSWKIPQTARYVPKSESVRCADGGQAYVH
jgi:hypothetical protein